MISSTSVVLLAVTILVILLVKKWTSRPTKKPNTNKEIPQIPIDNAPTSTIPNIQSEKSTNLTPAEDDILTIVYGTQAGTAKRYATTLATQSSGHNVKVKLVNVKEFDFDTLHTLPYIVFIVSTYTEGTPPDDMKTFYDWLEDTSQDHRVGRTFFFGLQYAVFGCGNSIYGKYFNTIARNVDEYIAGLSGKRLVPVGMGDVDTADMEAQFVQWTRGFWRGLKKIISKKKRKERGKQKERERATLAGEESASDENEGSGEMLELEDLGRMKGPANDDGDDEVELHNNPNEPLREMVGPETRKALTKQGYKIIGGHSGVKLCRWTKSMLRGRGGCYKHSFYGISSFQCMEMTPSLACANKCVFCWRHHTNPVAKEWKWKVDDPEFLVKGAIENHILIIKSARGIPGVHPERFKEAQTIKHCALSLVGEPIMYPHINKFLDLLHEKHISTFMVTNAQFPDQILTLKPVTQLYLSIDAGTKESLKAIDRPIFSDFWERFLASIDHLKEKGQRSVFRLTLVKSHNMDEIKSYAELIQRGVPDLIEVKGVTFCGDTPTSNLTIQNTPFHSEVVDFCKLLCNAANELVPNNEAHYELACEHEHSLCVLIANKNKYFKGGEWHTWIDYEKFHELANSGKHFTSVDYLAKTPSWALIGSKEQGFSPEEERFKRVAKSKPPTQGC